MKKAAALIIAVLYLAVSSGLVVEIHHCMGRIAGVSLLPPGGEKHTCESCGMEKGAGKCCKDELKFVQLQDTQKPATTGYQLTIPFVPVIPAYYHTPAVAVTASASPAKPAHGPPVLPASRCILYCVFRI